MGSVRRRSERAAASAYLRRCSALRRGESSSEAPRERELSVARALVPASARSEDLVPKRKNAKGPDRSAGDHCVRRRFKIGDRVRIVEISEDLKDVNYDCKDSAYSEMRTAELFRFCLGRVFRIYGFDRYGNAELRVSDSAAVRKMFGKWHTIWCEPEFLQPVGAKARNAG